MWRSQGEASTAHALEADPGQQTSDHDLMTGPEYNLQAEPEVLLSQWKGRSPQSQRPLGHEAPLVTHSLVLTSPF